MNALIPLPHRLGKYKGRTYSRYTVRVTQSGIGWQNSLDVEIVAATPADAVNAVQRELAPKVEQPTEFETVGPAGGRHSRFTGWESMVAAKMFACRPDYCQLALFAKR
jgi:hypothetical protein